MRLGIDASNLRAGGGMTHLVELLRIAQPQEHGFQEVIVWGGEVTLCRLEERVWLRKMSEPLLDRALPMRLYWQLFMLERLALREKCDLLFFPGGMGGGKFIPFVTMCRNMLPFEWEEARRFGISGALLRLMLLRWGQSWAFRKAKGIIFLTKYARDEVMKVIGSVDGVSAIIPHGVEARFVYRPREQHDIGYYSKDRPFRILYVSRIDVYKHQWNVVEAVTQLRRSGIPVRLDLVGSAYKPALKKLMQKICKAGIVDTFVYYHGSIPYAELQDWYKKSDMFVFASSCENMPNILLEAMASGLPIACSNKGPMFEILGDSGIYFDPEKPSDIADALKKIIDSPFMRAQKAEAAYQQTKVYTWKRCAEETFKFLVNIKLGC